MAIPRQRQLIGLRLLGGWDIHTLKGRWSSLEEASHTLGYQESL